MRLILASGSKIRAEMLRNAGVEIDVRPSDVDEDQIKQAMLQENASAEVIALRLADAKAGSIVGDLVLGADQVLVFDGQLFDKPKSVNEAKDQLKLLRDGTHELLSAAVVYENAKLVWFWVGQVKLTVRDFSDEFLDAYLDAEGEELLTTVGAYKLEGLGAQLFSKVEGDYFSVLGLPLLDVLEFLRSRKIGLK